MKLAWPEFEKAAGRKIRAEIRKDPELRKAAKRKRASSTIRADISSLIFFPFLMIFVGSAAKEGASLDYSLGVLTLVFLGGALKRGAGFHRYFYTSTKLATLTLLPLRDGQVFRVLWRGYLLEGAIYVGAVLIAYFFLFAFDLVGVWGWLAGAVMQVAVVFVCALHVAAWWPSPIWMMTGFLLQVLAVASLFFDNFGSQNEMLLRFLFWSSPPGWVHYLVRPESLSDPMIWLLLIPLGAVLGLVVFSYRRLAGAFSLEGIEWSWHHDPEAEPSAEFAQSSRRPGPTEMEDTIRSRFFLEAVQWENSGWVERFAARFLSAREKMVVEFLGGETTGWSRGYTWNLVVFGLALVAAWFLAPQGATALFLPAYFLAMAVFPVLKSEQWRGLRGGIDAGAISPLVGYPISFREALNVVLKISIIRTVPGIPMVLTFILVWGWRGGLSMTAISLIMIKVLAVMAAMFPLLVLAPFSGASNDTARYPMFFLLLFVPFLGLIGACGLLLFMANSPVWQAGSVVVMFSANLFLFWMYRRSYLKGKFDLVRAG